MNRTLEDMEKELVLFKRNVIDLEYEITKYKLDNGLYHSVSELEKYTHKDISYIVLVERNNDGSLSTKELCDRDNYCIGINIDGKVYTVSWDDDRSKDISFNDKIGKYVENPPFGIVTHDYIGFLELKLKENE
jgi:hypothetical protein